MFLRVENGLYFPLHDDVDPHAILYLAEHLIRRFQMPRELVAAGIGPQAAHITLPIQRVFHRSRLGSSVRTATLEELRERFG